MKSFYTPELNKDSILLNLIEKLSGLKKAPNQRSSETLYLVDLYDNLVGLAMILSTKNENSKKCAVVITSIVAKLFRIDEKTGEIFCRNLEDTSWYDTKIKELEAFK